MRKFEVVSLLVAGLMASVSAHAATAVYYCGTGGYLIVNLYDDQGRQGEGNYYNTGSEASCLEQMESLNRTKKQISQPTTAAICTVGGYLIRALFLPEAKVGAGSYIATGSDAGCLRQARVLNGD